MKQQWTLPGRATGTCPSELQTFISSSAASLTLLLLKVGFSPMKAPGYVASENCHLAAGKILQGHPSVQR